MDVDVDDVRRAKVMAMFYMSRGFQPLPSRPDAKRPMLCYADLWEKRAPSGLFDKFPTSNIQVMTGRFWRLMVIDADGPESAARLESMGPRLPKTWVSWSGGNGFHYWFMIPSNYPSEVTHAVLWKGDGEHEQIERLGDHKLIMAPPSIHPTTGARYGWKGKWRSPRKLPQPAVAPDWLVTYPSIEVEKTVETLPKQPTCVSQVVRRLNGERYRASDVLDAINDKVSLASSWGLRFASTRSNASGWCSCHAVGRPDKNPSASFSATTGRYWVAGQTTIDMFSLAVELGVYISHDDAVIDLARRFHAQAIA